MSTEKKLKYYYEMKTNRVIKKSNLYRVYDLNIYLHQTNKQYYLVGVWVSIGRCAGSYYLRG